MIWLRRLREFAKQSDWWLFLSPALIISLSLAVLYSISTVRTEGDLLFFYKQLIIAIIGMAAAVVISAFNYRRWQSIGPFLYIGILILLVLVLFFGQRIHATRGWLGLGSWSFQPVELAKTIFVIVFGAYFAKRARELNSFRYLSQSFVLMAIPVGLVLLQPDFGSAAILFSFWMSLLLIIGVKRRYVIGLFSLTAISFLVGWFYFFAPYQKERLISFMFPSERTQSQNYNVRQAIIALGSGELTGRGLGAGPQSQLKFLPEAGTDFIFAVVGEELGLVGIIVLLSLFGLWYYRVFRLLVNCRDDFASFVLIGAAMMIFIEIFVNAGMNMGIVPVVGVPFPLLSAGGSSLLSHLILLGIIAGIARQEKAGGYQISLVSAA